MPGIVSDDPYCCIRGPVHLIVLRAFNVPHGIGFGQVMWGSLPKINPDRLPRLLEGSRK